MKLNIRILNKSIVFLFILLVYNTAIQAQVTIGSQESPAKGALLDLKEQPVAGTEITAYKGLLLPRVRLENISELTPLVATTETNYTDLKLTHKGLTVYNVNPIESQNLTQGVYTWDGTRWQKAVGERGPRDFFYMPSIPISTTTNGTFTLDLYNLYKTQFVTPKVKSTGAPASIPYFANATDIYYYVSDYDPAVFSNISISASGVMTYTIVGTGTAYSYINIVFVIK